MDWLMKSIFGSWRKSETLFSPVTQVDDEVGINGISQYYKEDCISGSSKKIEIPKLIEQVEDIGSENGVKELNDFSCDQERSAELDQYRGIMSEIESTGLYISGDEPLKDPSKLYRARVTHILNCAGLHCKNYIANDEMFVSMSLNIADNPSEDINSFIYCAFDFIQAALEAKGKVLIHCALGVSRSCALAIAWLMFSRRISYEQAFLIVKEARQICAPNIGFVGALLEWEQRRQTMSPFCLRVSHHTPFSSTELVLRLCINSMIDSLFERSHLDSSTCFVLVTSSELDKALNSSDSSYKRRVFIWVGSLCSTNMLELAKVGAVWMEKYEGCASPITVHEGTEPNEFEKLLSQSTYTHQALNKNKIITDKFSKNTIREVEIDFEADSPHEHAETQLLGNSRKKSGPELFECVKSADGSYAWDKVIVYDYQDLVSESCLLLVDHFSASYFLWVGSDFTEKYILDTKLKDFYKCIDATSLLCILDFNGVIVENSSDESDQFWKVFEAGF